MKILFLNTTLTKGGAAIALKRLILGLNSNIDFRILTRDDKLKNINCYRTIDNKYLWYTERLLDEVSSIMGLQYMFLPMSKNEIIRNVKSFRPDVINIHNNLGGYFQTDLINALSKYAPIVWTLHDMWAMTAHCAYAYSCEKWKTKCSKCPNLKEYPSISIDTTSYLWEKKKNIYKDTDFTIITPSKWLEEQVKQSPLLKDKRIYHVNNGIDLNLFKPGNKKYLRKMYKIDESDFVLLFSAATIGDSRKGGNYVIEILKYIDKYINKKLVVLLIGKGKIHGVNKYKNIKFRKIGYISEESEMVNYYSLSDLFIFPTTADNLPNSLVESISCGLPAVTFDVGGCSEIIKDEISGVTVPAFNIELYAKHIIELLCDESKRVKLSISSRKYALENFDINLMVKKYISIFNNIK